MCMHSNHSTFSISHVMLKQVMMPFMCLRETKTDERKDVGTCTDFVPHVVKCSGCREHLYIAMGDLHVNVELQVALKISASLR